MGDKITILDFALAAVGFSSFLNEGNEAYDALRPIAEKHEIFHKYLLGLREEMKEHFDNRPKPRPMWFLLIKSQNV